MKTTTQPARPGLFRAFTLVEMLLVLVILSLLAALVYPKYTEHIRKSHIAAAKVQIAMFASALNVYQIDNGSYPRGANGLLDLKVRPQNAKNWSGPYLEKIPKDPWGNPYVYVCPGRHLTASFDLMSCGPDGLPNTTDDINNWDDDN